MRFLISSSQQLHSRIFHGGSTDATRSLSLKLGDTKVYEPQIRARLGSTDATNGSTTDSAATNATEGGANAGTESTSEGESTGEGESEAPAASEEQEEEEEEEEVDQFKQARCAPPNNFRTTCSKAKARIWP